MQAHSGIDKRLIVSWNDIERPLVVARMLIFIWAILCVALVLAKVSLSPPLPWVVILAPIWLPALAVLCILIGAIWLDQLAASWHG